MRELADLRADDNRISRYVWPDVGYLIGTLGSRDEFCSFLSHFLENSSGYLWEFRQNPFVTSLK